METTYYNNEYLLVEKVSYRLHEPRRGDTIVFKYPNDTSVNYIKRVIGLPGETVTIANGQVSINGNVLNEPYINGKKTYVSDTTDTQYEVKIGSGEYFVMGDNRDHSSDSRDGWLVPQNDIIGRSALVLYPSHNFHAVASPKY